MTAPQPQDPPDRSWIDFEYAVPHEGPISRLITNHTGWFVLILAVVLSAVIVGAALLGSSSGPGLVYDPQVVHRTIQTKDGRTVDCAVSHSGMSCDWGQR